MSNIEKALSAGKFVKNYLGSSIILKSENIIVSFS